MCISKSSKFFTLAFFLLLTNVLFQACSDEFNLFNEELRVDGGWEEITLVYANFNVSNKIHLIRINRGFAIGNFYSVHNIQDSVQYAPDELEVYFHMIYEGDTVKTYRCYDTIVHKEEGEYFNTGEVVLYAFRESNMLAYNVDGLEYMLEIHTPKNNVITAKTNSISSFILVNPNPVMPYYGFSSNQFRVRFNVPKNSQIYELSATVGYIEVSNQFDTVPFRYTVVVDRLISPRPATGDNYGQSVPMILQTTSNSFYRKLESTINTHGDTVNTLYRKFKNITIEVICGNSDLASAVSSGQSTTGFSDNLVSFSNVVGGLGNVSAYNKLVHSFMIDSATTTFVKRNYPQFKFKYRW